MTASRAAIAASLALAGCLTAGCTSFYEIGIETPIQPKLDVSAFQRVLVVGFVGGGTNDVDANMETVRLLRSQLRTRSQLKVIEAEVLPLAEVVERTRATSAPAAASDTAAPAAAAAPAADGSKITSEKELETYDQIFADVAYWKKLGEEYQSPLIITGTVYFAPINKSGIVERTTQEFSDAFGRRQVGTVRQWMDRKGYTLVPKLVFIDGRTGTTLYSESVREEILYDASQNTPALSAYFELMDRYLPSFLSALSSQKIRGTRVLLK
ncbi:MAG: hypothetical protein M3Q55_12455 [Acidobacteriota bacterium]|nr:hypothetical protein [Acidobacteriota bacterium]